MKRLVIALLVLLGLLVAADYGAAAAAESAVSRQMRQQLGLADDPSVRINGFPFLTQAISGDYSSVDVTAERVSFGQLREVEVRAQLRDVQAPLSELLASGPRTLRVGNAEGTIRISANDLARLITGVDKLRIENIDDLALEQAFQDGGAASLTSINPDSAARLVGTTRVLGQEVEVAVIAVLELSGQQIQVVPRDIRIGRPGSDDPQALPPPVQTALRALFTLRIDPGTLPLEVTPTRLRARDGTLEISGFTSGLVLGAGSAGGA
ncbi:LmeA family phospholipid-binding protein [Pseudonocardia bannensis]|uniref:DUF2993 domain-containing protein n=1 Tax=Pseudonocardia bannensis TaxID=630973 RepID=A0A848DQK5_9PSEU|nr:DUF2993 domain-containing protein [Pseudonocardia bannensis]NMH94789.1 DUF2993 domain-containing protein [Pseudonocardia bannensis]